MPQHSSAGRAHTVGLQNGSCRLAEGSLWPVCRVMLRIMLQAGLDPWVERAGHTGLFFQEVSGVWARALPSPSRKF